MSAQQNSITRVNCVVTKLEAARQRESEKKDKYVKLLMKINPNEWVNVCNWNVFFYIPKACIFLYTEFSYW